MLTSEDERAILDDLRDGVELALHERGAAPEAVDRIGFNKLAYLAVREYDLPVTYGWYKYGPAPADTARVTDSLTPRSASEIRAIDEPRVRSVNHDLLGPREYALFFTRDCEEFDSVVETPTKEYLLDFYFQFAPDRYRDLYVASTELQQSLDRLDDPTWHTDADRTITTVTERYTRLLREVVANPVLREASGPVREFGETLCGILDEAATQDELSESQQRFLGRVVDFFYGNPWTYVALLISKDTVDESPGTNRQRLKNATDDDLRSLRATYDDELRRLREQATRRDLRGPETDCEHFSNDLDRYETGGEYAPSDDETVSTDEMLDMI